MPINAINIAIALTGAVSASLPRSINTTISNLQRLQNQARRTAMTFAGLNLGRFGGGLLGLGAAGGGYAAFASFRNMMEESVRLAKEQENVTALLTVQLREQARLRHQDLGIADAQLGAIQKQARALQEQTGIYQNVYLKGAAILAQAGLTTQQIQHMQPYIAQLIVANRMMGKSAEDMGEVYQAISKAVVGMGRNLLSVGVKLDPITRELMVMAAKMHDFAYNINILEQTIAKVYGGAAVKYMRTLIGQADLAAAHIKDWKRRFGDAIIPVQLQLVRLQGQLFDIFGPYTLVLLKKFEFGINLITKEFMRNREAIKNLVAQGWGKLIMLWQWFKDNRSWLVPFLAFIAKWFVMSRIGMIAWWAALSPIISILRILMPLVGAVSAVLSGPVGLTAATIAAAAAAVLLVNHWDKVKDFFSRDNIGRTIFENIFGTKKTLEAFGGFAPRATPAGSARGIKRAQPVIKGWIQELKESLGEFFMVTLPREFPGWIKAVYHELEAFSDKVEKWTTKMVDVVWGMIQPELQKYWNIAVDDAKEIWGKLTKWFDDTWKSIIKELQEAWEGVVKRFDEKIWEPLKAGFKGVGDAIQTYLLGPLKSLNDLWRTFLESLNLGTGGEPPGPGRGGLRLNPASYTTNEGTIRQGDITWVRSLTGNTSLPSEPTAGGFKIWEQYPWEDRSSRFGPNRYRGQEGNPLRLGYGVGIGRYIQSALGIRQGDWVYLSKGIGWRQINEASSRKWGVEFYSRFRGEYDKLGDIQILKIRRLGENVIREVERRRVIPGEGGGTEASAVHVHNHVTYNIHGSTHDIENRIANLHRQHIENLKRDLEEVHYRLARNSFVNRAAWT